MIGLSYDQLKTLAPCPEGRARAARKLGGAREWNGNLVSARQAKDAGVSFEDIVWAASALAQTDKEVERRLRLWMADCAARVLHIFEGHVPGDGRVRAAIVAARQFARGQIEAAAWAAAAAAAGAARDAARDARDAWAAAAAAAGAARDAARAARDAVGDAEEAWQFERLVTWLSDPEPEDVDLPPMLTGGAA